jgi:hypothetical protein
LAVIGNVLHFCECIGQNRITLITGKYKQVMGFWTRDFFNFSGWLDSFFWIFIAWRTANLKLVGKTPLLSPLSLL